MNKSEIEQRVESAEKTIQQIKDKLEHSYRNQVIEEVAQAIMRMESFGQDTLDSFAIYIRSLKHD